MKHQAFMQEIFAAQDRKKLTAEREREDRWKAKQSKRKQEAEELAARQAAEPKPKPGSEPALEAGPITEKKISQTGPYLLTWRVGPEGFPRCFIVKEVGNKDLSSFPVKDGVTLEPLVRAVTNILTRVYRSDRVDIVNTPEWVKEFFTEKSAFENKEIKARVVEQVGS